MSGNLKTDGQPEVDRGLPSFDDTSKESESDDSISSADISNKQGDDEMSPITEDTYEEQAEDSSEDSDAAQEDSNSTDASDEADNNKKDKSVSIFGYDLSKITESAGEEASKGFSKVEKYLKEHFAFNEDSNEDKDANSDNPNAKEKISSVAKTLLDAYYDALTVEDNDADNNDESADGSAGENTEIEKSKQVSEAFVNKVKELLNDGKISEDDAKKLEKEFAKTDAVDGDSEMTESDAGSDSAEAADAE